MEMFIKLLLILSAQCLLFDYSACSASTSNDEIQTDMDRSCTFHMMHFPDDDDVIPTNPRSTEKKGKSLEKKLESIPKNCDGKKKEKTKTALRENKSISEISSASSSTSELSHVETANMRKDKMRLASIVKFDLDATREKLTSLLAESEEFLKGAILEDKNEIASKATLLKTKITHFVGLFNNARKEVAEFEIAHASKSGRYHIKGDVAMEDARLNVSASDLSLRLEHHISSLREYPVKTEKDKGVNVLSQAECSNSLNDSPSAVERVIKLSNQLRQQQEQNKFLREKLENLEVSFSSWCDFRKLENLKVKGKELENVKEMTRNFPTPTSLPKCFLDIYEGYKSLGKIVIELRSDVVPETAENFRALCTGERGISYKGSHFWNIQPNLICQGGTIRGEDYSGKQTIYGDYVNFEPESFAIKHELGTVSMMTSENGYLRRCFFITMRKNYFLHSRHVAFGKVVEGMDVLRRMESYGSISGKTSKEIVIKNCGQVD